MNSGKTIFSQLMESSPRTSSASVSSGMGQLQGQELLLLGPVPMHGLRSTHLPRESARYSGLSAGSPDQALWQDTNGRAGPTRPSPLH